MFRNRSRTIDRSNRQTMTERPVVYKFISIDYRSSICFVHMIRYSNQDLLHFLYQENGYLRTLQVACLQTFVYEWYQLQKHAFGITLNFRTLSPMRDTYRVLLFWERNTWAVAKSKSLVLSLHIFEILTIS